MVKARFYSCLECLDCCHPRGIRSYVGRWFLARVTRDWTRMVKVATYFRRASYAGTRGVLLTFGRKALETTS